MNNISTGAVIRKLRIEKGYTQQGLADKIGVSDKAVSKWERGLGCPDVSLLGSLATALGTTEKTLLDGEYTENEKDKGNMKKQNFYYCESCGNIVTATGTAEITCCGKRLSPLEIRESDEKHAVSVENVEDELYITMSHSMHKEHYITFVAYQSFDRFYMVKTYPEQDMALRLPNVHGGRIIVHCNKDGLFEKKL